MKREYIVPIDFIGDIPPDNEEIVRCKDCRHCDEDTMECKIRMGWFAVSPNWFCADGQRKDSD